MLDILLPIIVAVSGFALGFMLARAVKQAPPMRDAEKPLNFGFDKDENTCRMYATCDNLVNPACISGQCNMHCRIFCKCGVADNPTKKENWADVLTED